MFEDREDRNQEKICSVVQLIFGYTIAVLAIGLVLLAVMALTGCQQKGPEMQAQLSGPRDMDAGLPPRHGSHNPRHLHHRRTEEGRQIKIEHRYKQTWLISS